ncbi:hypothetical protein [Paraliomyxa miuraensis]|uniref:hypothetical protein n=1 Tax=Paraliomyxa miuraensis TaxID=376150 RepID=UPI0022562613|nr:hypothetical protein [Paraliomyxa miuraensis]MCX4240785.1 hypothetical protein [Paraliomyxa miuraensis]
MHAMHRRLAPIAGLGLGIALGQGCYDGPLPVDTDVGSSTGPYLCGPGFVTCPDNSCQPPAPGACCGHGGLCPSDDTGPVDPTNTTLTTSTTLPPTSTTLPPDTTTDMTASATDTSSSGGESSSSGGESTSSSSGGESTSTTTGGMLPGCYDPMTFPWSGPLCGPAAAPCVVQASETIEPMQLPRNGTPSIAVNDDCEPAVLHATSQGGTLGFFAQRTAPGVWDVQPTPFPMSQGGLDFDPVTGFFGAMVYEGAFQVSARIHDGVAWNGGDPLMGSQSLSTKAFALTGDATLHGVLQQPAVGFVDATWPGAWMLAGMPSGGPTDLSPALAVAPDGTHHFTYWSTGGMSPMLRWETSAGGLEDVMPYGIGPVSPALAQELVLTDDGAGAMVPHVIAGAQTAIGNRVQVIHARRDGAALWTTSVVASEDPTGETTCDVPPLGPGELCTLDRTTYRPLAIASSLGGDVRWLYTEVHELVDYASDCMPGCEWVPLVDMSTYDVLLGWLEGGAPQSTVILPDVRAIRANMEVDGQGVMHVVAYAEEVPDAAATGLTVEYFQLAP